MRALTSSSRFIVWIFGLVVCCAQQQVVAQNLVPNPSFEAMDSCLHWGDPFSAPDIGTFQDWFSGGGTVDPYLSCYDTVGWSGVPQGGFAYQYPQDGDNFIGLVTYEVNSGGLREYAMVQLVTPLVQGQTYFVSFYANAAWNNNDTMYAGVYIASSHIGALFTMQPRPWSSGDPWPLATGSAHVVHPWIISDTIGWTLVSGSFVADSAYQYLMVGNHYDNNITDTVSLGPSIQLPIGYTLIDNICVSMNPLGCPLANGVAQNVARSVVLFPNPAENLLQLQGVSGTAHIHDGLGRMVWSGKVSKRNWRLDVGTWARGSYVLRIISGTQQRSFKFVLIE